MAGFFLRLGGVVLAVLARTMRQRATASDRRESALAARRKRPRSPWLPVTLPGQIEMASENQPQTPSSSEPVELLYHPTSRGSGPGGSQHAPRRPQRTPVDVTDRRPVRFRTGGSSNGSFRRWRRSRADPAPPDAGAA